MNTLFASKGDTTRVITHSKVVIKTNPSIGSTTYPAWGVFPADSIKYRKVYLYMEFGCAPGLNCGEWDYINSIYLGRKGGVKCDSLYYELSRFITPYGNQWNAASNWKHGWYYDLTDYAFLLHDSLEIIYKHTGYEANNDRGWTVTLDFKCIEGTPVLEPKGVTRFFEVSAPYGNINSPFKNALPDKNFTVKSGADMVRFKTIQTGHGFNTTENCSEFCDKVRTISIDNNTTNSRHVWRSDCGLNSLYPQAGTWLYDRAGWCPGAPVKPADFDLKLSENSQHTYSLNMEDYTNTAGSSANYYISAYAMYFKDNRKVIDAAIDDILAPSSHLDYLRLNPECGAPIIRIKNMGTETIRKIYFEYGKLGGKIQYIEVQCNIPSMQDSAVNLEAIYDWSGPGNTFYAKILKVNNQTDENDENNVMYSKITNTVTWPNKIIVVLSTNNAASENYYRITDSKGNIVKFKDNLVNNKVYRDTVQLENNICYKFELFDDGPGPANNPLNKDGLSWWANSTDGNGSIVIRNGITNAVLKNFGADFGTKIMHNFYTTFSMDVPSVFNQGDAPIQIRVFPNPSDAITNFSIDYINNVTSQIAIFDAAGKQVFMKEVSALFTAFNLEQLSSGMYSIVVTQGDQVSTQKFIVK
ncbi:MAG: peptide-N-glycosidase F-related protein [bacterium]|nr:peptide-N-glycosidase F-related protein [bacterium]